MEGKKGLQKRRTGIKEVEKTGLGLLVYGFWRKFGVLILRNFWQCECGARSVFRNILTKSRKDTPRRQKVPDTSKNFETLGKNVPLGIIICRLANTRCEPIFLFSQEQPKVLTKAWQLRKFYFTQNSPNFANHRNSKNLADC